MGGKSSKPTAAVGSSVPEKAAAPRGCCSPPDPADKRGFLPDRQRKCRDCFGCLIFLAFWVGMIIIGAYGFMYGNINSLIYGIDYAGNVCGSAGTRGYYITYPRINEDFIANIGVNDPTKLKFYGICVSACPAALQVVCNNDKDVKTEYWPTVGATPTPFSSFTSSQLEQCVSYNNPALPAGPGTNGCAEIRANCWVTPQVTTSIMYRCVPQYSTATSNVQVSCAYPTNIADPNDARCVLTQTNSTGTVIQQAKPNALFQQLNSQMQTWGRYIGDLQRCWWVILVCAVGVAVATGFIFTTLIKYFVGCMVWTIITLTLTLVACLTGYFYFLAGMVSPSLLSAASGASATIPGAASAVASASSAQASFSSYTGMSLTSGTSTGPGSSYAIIAYVSTAVLIILLCMVISLGASIRKAIEVVRLGSDALKSTPSLLFFPCTTTLATVVFLIWWLFVAASLASSGSVTMGNLQDSLAQGASALAASTGNATLLGQSLSLITAGGVNSTASWQSTNSLNYVLIYHFFGLLWTCAFIGGVATVTIAGAVGTWYFSEMPKDAPEELQKLKYPRSKFPVLASLLMTLRYYLGTVAAGSLLIALVQMLRAVMAYVSHRLKSAAEGNSWIKWALCLVNCCLACLDCCVQLITRNAYIFVAIKGDGFLGSGRRVFKLIMDHGTVFAVVNVLGEIIVFLGKLCIAVTSTFACYLMLNNISEFSATGKNPLSSTWLPVLITLFFSYVVGASFMMVFDLAVDTVLVCYVTDCDENKQNGGSDLPIHFSKDKLLKVASGEGGQSGVKK